MSANQPVVARDLGVLWHPCTQMKDHEQVPLIPIRRAQGVWLEDLDGRRYLDAISSWWVNLHGHGHPHINRALQRQVEQLEQVLLAGFTHEPAVNLAERLVALTPDRLTRCFYADNGSSAIEAALKMSFHYWRNLGHDRKRLFVTLSNSYHGETLGALAASDVSLYRETYGPLLMPAVLTVPSPDCYERAAGEDCETHAAGRFRQLEALLAERADEICAVILEPLVQCAGGMRMYPPSYLKLVREACDRHGVHLIADEIAVGFGRTGTLFACEQAAISPDLMCLSKGLTGGYLPLSAVLASEQIYRAFYADYLEGKAFLHSHSYTGNPLACAVALASLEVFEQERVLERNRMTAALLGAAATPLQEHPQVAEVRQTGMILAFELVRDRATREPYPAAERRGLRAYRYALSSGVLLRPLGNVLYWMPPYVIDADQIALLARITAEAIDHACAD